MSKRTTEVIGKEDVATVKAGDLLPVLRAPGAIKAASLKGAMPLTSEQSSAIPMPEGFSIKDFDIHESTTALPPTVQWNEIGEQAGGFYQGCEDGIGPNKSRLYNFEYKDFRFGIWGGFAIDQMFDTQKPKEGDFVWLTYIADVDVDRDKPCRQFHVRIMTPKKK